ncbi:conserved hypothetical protein [Planktothrix agardhii]|nr:conserved hypothetical protein [Planktothrix agardhii]
MTSPPTPLLRGEGGLIITIKHKKLFITPPSLVGKGVGGLGLRGWQWKMKQPCPCTGGCSLALY